MNAADLAAQMVAGARVAEVIEVRRKEFQILEVGSSALMVDCFSRESAAHTLNRSQGKLQSLLSEGWKIETQFATSCLIPAREECVDDSTFDARGTKELRACCRPTETGAGPSDARIAAAASHCSGVFLVCACCLEFSRTLEDPHWIRRRRDRPLCAPQARPAHTRQRATGARTMSACLSYVVMLCHQRHCRATLQCRPLRDRA